MPQRIGNLSFDFDEFLTDAQTDDARTEELTCIECQGYMTRYDGWLKKEQRGVSIFTPCECPQEGSEHRKTAVTLHATVIYQNSTIHSKSGFQLIGHGTISRWKDGGFYILDADYAPKINDVILTGEEQHPLTKVMLSNYGLRIGHNVGGAAYKLLEVEEETIPS